MEPAYLAHVSSAFAEVLAEAKAMADRGAAGDELAEVLRHAGDLLATLVEEMKGVPDADVARLVSDILRAQLEALRAALLPGSQ